MSLDFSFVRSSLPSVETRDLKPRQEKWAAGEERLHLGGLGHKSQPGWRNDDPLAKRTLEKEETVFQKAEIWISTSHIQENLYFQAESRNQEIPSF